MRVIGTFVCRFPWVQFLVIRNGEPENGQLISTCNWKTGALLLSLSWNLGSNNYMLGALQAEHLYIFAEWKFLWNLNEWTSAYIECTTGKWYHSIELAERFHLKYRCWTFAKITASALWNKCLASQTSVRKWDGDVQITIVVCYPPRS